MVVGGGGGRYQHMACFGLTESAYKIQKCRGSNGYVSVCVTISAIFI